MKGLFILLAIGLYSQAQAGLIPTVHEIPYTVVEKSEGYELRQYQSETMVCATMENIDPSQDPMNGWQSKYHNAYLAMMLGPWKEEPTCQMFYKLFNYISGDNADKTKIPMTSPVPMFHVPTESSGLEKQTQCFWLGTQYRTERPPMPNDGSDVQVVSVPAFQIYVTQFGGFALSDDDFRTPYNQFKQSLLAADKKIEKDAWLSCSYDAPFVPFKRRNEVWILKKL